MTWQNSRDRLSRSVWGNRCNTATQWERCVWAWSIERKSWNFGWNTSWEIPRALPEIDTSCFVSSQTSIICGTLVHNFNDNEFVALSVLQRCPGFGIRRTSNKLSTNECLEVLFFHLQNYDIPFDFEHSTTPNPALMLITIFYEAIFASIKQQNIECPQNDFATARSAMDVPFPRPIV